MSVSQSPFLRVTHGLTMVSAYMSALAILAATLIIVEQVWVRYLFNAATIWQVEIAVYLLIAALSGRPYGLAERPHQYISVVWLPGSGRSTSSSFRAPCFAFFWHGCVMWWEALKGMEIFHLLSSPLFTARSFLWDDPPP
jgi:TRAP-type C4-dicarboxylate transport system permease small subunit